MHQDFKDLIKKSGNNLHLEVADALKDKGWDVELSSYYYDDTTDKPREIDIVANRNEGVGSEAKGSQGGKVIDTFNVSLYIECKYFTKDVAFRMWPIGEQEQDAALHLNKITKGKFITFMNNNSSHHNSYYRSIKNVGKLHDTENEKSVFDALTQPIKSLIFSKDDDGTINKIYIPVVVYTGIDGIYPIQGQDQNLDKLQPFEYLSYGLNYAYRSAHTGFLKREFFIVDFVHENLLSKYLIKIEKDIDGVREYLWKNQLARELGKPPL